MPDRFALSRSLFMLTDPDVPQEALAGQLASGIRGGVTHVILRRPAERPARIYQLAADMVGQNRLSRPSCRVIVHDRADIALAVDADGVHLPGDGLPGEPARTLLTHRRMLGRSVHSREAAMAAQGERSDYLLFGHIFATPSHPELPGRGLDALREVARAVSIPVIAIGGITADRVDDVLAAGASGIAVIRAISRADDLEAAARAFRIALDRAQYPHLSPMEES